jgi:hypothetical protein
MPVIGTNSSQPAAEKSFSILRITEDHSRPVTQRARPQMKNPYPMASDGKPLRRGRVIFSERKTDWGFLYLFSNFCVPRLGAVNGEGRLRT